MLQAEHSENSQHKRRGGSSEIEEMHYVIHLAGNNPAYHKAYLFKQECYHHFYRQGRPKLSIIFCAVFELQKRSPVRLEFSADILQAIQGIQSFIFY